MPATDDPRGPSALRGGAPWTDDVTNRHSGTGGIFSPVRHATALGEISAPEPGVPRNTAGYPDTFRRPWRRIGYPNRRLRHGQRIRLRGSRLGRMKSTIFSSEMTPVHGT